MDSDAVYQIGVLVNAPQIQRIETGKSKMPVLGGYLDGGVVSHLLPLKVLLLCQPRSE